MERLHLHLLLRAGCSLVAAFSAWPALADTPAQLLDAYSKQAGTAPSAERGRRLFTTNFGQPLGWSCSSCHGNSPAAPGRDQLSEKEIEPLAPAANPKRFTDRNKVEIAFSQNCKDVVGRPCSAAEKADVLSWLLSLKP
jgi:mono/diheme cytochrome c family protein